MGRIKIIICICLTLLITAGCGGIKKEPAFSVPAITPLSEDDPEQAFDLVRPCIVQLHAPSGPDDGSGSVQTTYGSGMITGFTKDTLTILTSCHVAAPYITTDGNGSAGDTDITDITEASWQRYAIFLNGDAAAFRIIHLDEENDLALAEVSVSDLEEETLSLLRVHPLTADAATTLTEGDPVLVVHSKDLVYQDPESVLPSAEDDPSGIADSYFTGKVIAPRAYVEALSRQMLYCSCDAWPGMSGGGIFDHRGNLLGLLSGGTFDSEVVALPLSDILELLPTPTGQE